MTNCGFFRCLALIAGLTLVGCGSPPAEVNNAPVPMAPSQTASSSVPSSGDFVTTASGLRYKILKPSDGPRPAATDTVRVNYRGWFDNGKEFDSGKGIEFPLNGVIAGWTEGVQLIGEGGTIELEVPPELGYGNSPPPGIPPGSTLHFEVDLVDVK